MKSFSPNRVVIQAETSPSQPGYWLLYKDSWGKHWRATVNGNPEPILRVNMAFKAVQIPSGKSEVTFSHFIPWMQWMINFGCMICILLLSYFFLWVFRLRNLGFERKC